VNQAVTVHLKWQDYLDRCLNRLKDTVESESLLTFLTKVRDDALPCYLWIAERRAQRQELERDLVVLPESMWLAYIVNFLTADERLILKVPADKDFTTYNAGAGYTLTDLENECSSADPHSFKKFRQSACSNPLAKRLLSFVKTSPKKPDPKVDKEKPKPKKEDTPPKPPKPKESKQQKSSGKPLTGDALKKVDLAASLPQKDGKPHQEKYDSFNDGSLRKRVWDRMQERKCIRCASDKHLRSACEQSRQKWEDDFDTGAAFWEFTPKQSRAQWSPSSRFLRVKSDIGMVAIDTCSDVSTGLKECLKNIRPCPPVLLHHLGGVTTLDQCGEVVVVDRTLTAFVVPPSGLPPGFSLLLGMPEIVDLDIRLTLSSRTLAARSLKLSKLFLMKLKLK